MCDGSFCSDYHWRIFEIRRLLMACILQLRAMLRSQPGQKATRPHHRDPTFAKVRCHRMSPDVDVTNVTKLSTAQASLLASRSGSICDCLPRCPTGDPRASQDVPPAPPPFLGLPSRPQARRDGASGISPLSSCGQLKL